jgi:hypothetical protein
MSLGHEKLVSVNFKDCIGSCTGLGLFPSYFSISNHVPGFSQVGKVRNGAPWLLNGWIDHGDKSGLSFQNLPVSIEQFQNQTSPVYISTRVTPELSQFWKLSTVYAVKEAWE